MSIASEITRIQGNISDAYTAANGKGATMPATQNSANLATTISSIQTGITPSGTKQITTNGTHNVAGYANADVQVPTTAPAHYIERNVDANGTLVNEGGHFIDLTGVTDLGYRILYWTYNNNTTVSAKADMSSLTQISGEEACNRMCFNCVGITSLDVSSLKSVSGSYALSSAFQASGLTGVIDLSALETVSGNGAFSSCFQTCGGITGVDISNFSTVESGKAQCFQNCFSYCTGLTTFSFTSFVGFLTNKLFYQCFERCTNLSSLYFPSLRADSNSANNAFNNMLKNITGCTVHFPSNQQSVIGSWSDVTNGFGGINTTVLFDLPATNTLTGADAVTYTRNPKYDTATALAWKVGAYGTTNFTPAYYTSGTTDPGTSDTIYSDAACTTAVTTISSIS